MLTNVLLLLIYGVILVVTAPLRLFSDVSLPAVVSSTVSSINGYLTSAFSWLPLTVTAILATWGVLLTVETAVFLYKGIMWIIKKIPGIN